MKLALRLSLSILQAAFCKRRFVSNDLQAVVFTEQNTPIIVRLLICTHSGCFSSFAMAPIYAIFTSALVAAWL